MREVLPVKKTFVALGVFIVMFGMGLGFNRSVFDVFAASVAGYNDISGTDAVQVMKTEKDILVLDVRTEQEFHGELGHLKGAKLIPVDDLARRIDEIAAFKKKKVLVVCRSGVRSRRAATMLMNSGFENVHNIFSGMIGMNQVPGAPIER